MKRHFKSRYPGAIVPHTNETISADYVSMKVPGEADGLHGHGGAEGLYIFYGGTSKHDAVYPCSGPGAYPKCLREYIREHGAPACIRTDSASVELSAEVLEIYRDYSIRDGQSEPYYQNQNPCEREIQDFKKMLAHILNITDTPYEYSPLAAEYIAGLPITLLKSLSTIELLRNARLATSLMSPSILSSPGGNLSCSLMVMGRNLSAVGLVLLNMWVMS